MILNVWKCYEIALVGISKWHCAVELNCKWMKISPKILNFTLYLSLVCIFTHEARGTYRKRCCLMDIGSILTSVLQEFGFELFYSGYISKFSLISYEVFVHFLPGSMFVKKCMLKSRLVNKDVQTLNHFGWQHSRQPIRSHVENIC